VVNVGYSLVNFCREIGYHFENESFLTQALTHASSVYVSKLETYERLEFLGDRVLGLVVSEFLMGRYPNENEGQLSRRLSALVDRENLTSVAADMKLENYIIYGGGAELNDSMQADVVEAVFGAIYCDGGLEPAKKVIEKFICRLSDNAQVPRIDPKTSLQEWAQGKKMGLPSYKEIGKEGPDHQPIFFIQVMLDGFEPKTARGSSKRAAEQAAALKLLNDVTEISDD
tara:strand:- start:2736 stop:3419 length:684 start_codon:yes stop_codon:yes gene_type:complete